MESENGGYACRELAGASFYEKVLGCGEGPGGAAVARGAGDRSRDGAPGGGSARLWGGVGSVLGAPSRRRRGRGGGAQHPGPGQDEGTGAGEPGAAASATYRWQSSRRPMLPDNPTKRLETNKPTLQKSQCGSGPRSLSGPGNGLGADAGVVVGVGEVPRGGMCHNAAVDRYRRAVRVVPRPLVGALGSFCRVAPGRHERGRLVCGARLARGLVQGANRLGGEEPPLVPCGPGSRVCAQSPPGDRCLLAPGSGRRAIRSSVRSVRVLGLPLAGGCSASECSGVHAEADPALSSTLESLYAIWQAGPDRAA